MLTSDQGLLPPKELSEEITAAIRRARLQVIADCGRLSQAERPAEVAAALVAWRNG